MILQLDKSDDRLEAVGLCLKDSKDLLGRLQHAVVEAQAAAYVNRHRRCSLRLPSAWQGAVPDRLPHRVRPCSARKPALLPLSAASPADSQTFSPLAELFTEHTAPELLYLETRWASLVSFGMTADLLKDVLPVGSTANAATIRQHLHKVAARQDADLGGEQPGLG